MLSLFGTWIVEGFWEKVLVPAVGWLIRGAVDLDKVNDISQIEAFANGQCIAMQRAAYFTIEGHKSVRDQVLEDVRFAEVVKRKGMAVQVRPAAWAFRVRLYRSLVKSSMVTQRIYMRVRAQSSGRFWCCTLCLFVPYCHLC